MLMSFLNRIFGRSRDRTSEAHNAASDLSFRGNVVSLQEVRLDAKATSDSLPADAEGDICLSDGTVISGEDLDRHVNWYIDNVLLPESISNLNSRQRLDR